MSHCVLAGPDWTVDSTDCVSILDSLVLIHLFHNTEKIGENVHCTLTVAVGPVVDDSLADACDGVATAVV